MLVLFQTGLPVVVPTNDAVRLLWDRVDESRSHSPSTQTQSGISSLCALLGSLGILSERVRCKNPTREQAFQKEKRRPDLKSLAQYSNSIRYFFPLRVARQSGNLI